MTKSTSHDYILSKAHERQHLKKGLHMDLAAKDIWMRKEVEGKEMERTMDLELASVPKKDKAGWEFWK